MQVSQYWNAILIPRPFIHHLYDSQIGKISHEAKRISCHCAHLLLMSALPAGPQPASLSLRPDTLRVALWVVSLKYMMQVMMQSCKSRHIHHVAVEIIELLFYRWLSHILWFCIWYSLVNTQCHLEYSNFYVSIVLFNVKSVFIFQ